MKIRNYLLDHNNLDWPNLLASWHWLLPETLTVWFVNRFGDIFATVDDGSVHMLDVGCGTFKRLADSQVHLGDLLDDVDNANDWLMIPLIDRLVEAGKVLRPGTCYSYVQLPVIGGEYSVENTMIVPIEEHFGMNAEIQLQIKDLPDGTNVRINFSED